MSSKDRVAREMKQLRLLFGGHCKRCGGNKQLEFAHLQPTGLDGESRGSKERPRDIKKNMDKYELLCRPCHKVRDQRS